MPATVAASTKPPVIQGDVIALFTQGTSKRSIAKRLQIDRATVDRIIRSYCQDKPISASRVQQLVPLAYDAVEQGLRRGDARIGMDFLKVTELSDRAPTELVVKDSTFNTLVTHIPSATPSTASPASTAGTEPAGTAGATEAAAKTAPINVDLTCHTNFSNFSLAELEAEVARRKAQLIEVEVGK